MEHGIVHNNPVRYTTSNELWAQLQELGPVTKERSAEHNIIKNEQTAA